MLKVKATPISPMNKTKKVTSETLNKTLKLAEKVRPRIMEMTKDDFRHRFSSEIEEQAEVMVDGHTNDNEMWGMALKSAYDLVSSMREDEIRIVDEITPLQWKELANTEAVRILEISVNGLSLNEIEVTVGDAADEYCLAENQSAWSFNLKRLKKSLLIYDESCEGTIARYGKKDGPYIFKALEFIPAGFISIYDGLGDFVINLKDEDAKKYLVACGFPSSNIE